MDVARTWESISVAGFVLAGAFLLVAIILFIKFRIWTLPGELSGRTAARQMEEIRKGNREVVGRWNRMDAPSSDKPHASMRQTQILHQKNSLTEEEAFGMPAASQEARQTELLQGNPANRKGTGTDLLGNSNSAVEQRGATGSLEQNAVEQRGATGSLEQNAAEQRGMTGPLEQGDFSPVMGAFHMKKNVVVVHTEEMLEE